MSRLSPSEVTRPHAPALPGGPRASWRAPSLLALTVAATTACTADEPTETLQVSARGSTLLAVRQGGAWEPMLFDRDGNGALAVTGPYELVQVCADTAATRAVLAGPETFEGPLDLACQRPSARVQVTIAITAVAAPTTIYVGAQAQRLDGAATRTTFELDQFGRYDVVAVTDDHHVLVKRDIVVAAPTTVGLDLAGAAVALEHRAFLNRDAGRPYTRLTTAGGTAVDLTNGHGGGLWVPPPSALQPGDVVYAGVRDDGVYTRRHSLVAIDPSATTPLAIPLRAPLEDVTFGTAGVASARWSASGEWTWATVTTTDHDASGRATASWQVEAYRPAPPDGARAALAMPDVTTIPGWQSAWTVTGADADWAVTLRHPGEGAAIEEVTETVRR